MLRILAVTLLVATLGVASANPLPMPEEPPAAVPVDEDGNMLAPATVTQNVDAIWTKLETAPWLHSQDGTHVLYVITFRSCSACLEFKAAEYEKLLAAGVDVRWIVYARRNREGKERSKPGERAMVAELWQTRSYAEWERWYVTDPQTFYDTEPLPPSADDGGAREALVNASRQLVDDLSDLTAHVGVELGIPALFWRAPDGELRTYFGYDAEGFKPVFAELTTAPASP